MAFPLCMHAFGVSPLIRTQVLFDLDPNHVPSYSFITFLTALSSNTFTLRVRASTYGFWWHIIQCIREGDSNPLLYSRLENPMDGGAWWAAVHGVDTSRTQLSDFTFTFHFHALEKEMATHSSVLALRIPGTGEPGGLPSMGSHRVGHDWSDLAAAAAIQCIIGGIWMGIFCGVSGQWCDTWYDKAVKDQPH